MVFKQQKDALKKPWLLSHHSYARCGFLSKPKNCAASDVLGKPLNQPQAMVDAVCS